MAADSHIVLRRSPRGVAPRDAERSLAATIVGEIADDPRIVAASESGDQLPDGLVRSAAVILERAGVMIADRATSAGLVRESRLPAA
jgi:hypothetical protein